MDSISDSSRCVTLGSLLYFSERQFPHLEIGSHDWLYHTALSIGSSESLCSEHLHCPNCLIKTPDVILDSSSSLLRSLSLHPVGLIFKVYRESGCFLSCTWLPPWSSPCHLPGPVQWPAPLSPSSRPNGLKSVFPAATTRGRA